MTNFLETTELTAGPQAHEPADQDMPSLLKRFSTHMKRGTRTDFSIVD